MKIELKYDSLLLYQLLYTSQCIKKLDSLLTEKNVEFCSFVTDSGSTDYHEIDDENVTSCWLIR